MLVHLFPLRNHKSVKIQAKVSGDYAHQCFLVTSDWLQGCVKSGGGSSVMKALPLWVGVLVCVNRIPDLPCWLRSLLSHYGQDAFNGPTVPIVQIPLLHPSISSLHPIYAFLFIFSSFFYHAFSLPCPFGPSMPIHRCQPSAKSNGDLTFSQTNTELYGWI